MAHLYTAIPPGEDEHDRIAEHQSGDISELSWISHGDHLQPFDSGDEVSTFWRSSGVFPHRSISPLAENIHDSGAPQYTLESFQSGEKPPQARTTFSSVPSSVHDPAGPGSWYLEIGAVILSFLALAAAIIVLRFEDGKPITQYTFYLSLNTVISILGTIAKSSLAFALAACMGQGKWNWFRSRRSELVGFQRFDEASRGPWGSMKFLWWLRMRHWTALGAVIIILLLGFDPFLQAIIYYNGELDVDLNNNNLTNIAKADSLDIGTWRFNSQETVKIDSFNATFNTASTFPDFGLSAAVYEGFSVSSALAIQRGADYGCPSGNCTWPIYTSLAVCSACSDLTTYINKSSGFGDGDEALLTDGNSPTFEDNYTRYDIAFATNLHIMNVNGFCDYPCIDNELMTAKPTSDPRQTITFQNLTTMLLAVGIMEADNAYNQNRSAWEDTPITATECALYLCAKVYSSKVQDNLLYEDYPGSWAIREPNSWQPATEQKMSMGLNITAIQEFVTSLNNSLYWGDYESVAIRMTDLQIVIPDNAQMTSGSQGSPLPSNVSRTFNVSQASIASTIDFLLGMWPSDNTSQPDGEGQFNIYLSPDDQYVFTAPIMQALYESPEPMWQFENVANSTSNYIRGLGVQPQVGSAQIWVTHVHVRWGFVALPAFVFIAGCVFTLFSIIETRRLAMPAWKENAMPVLTYGLDGKMRALMRGAGAKGEHKARKTMVRLVDEGDGLELKP